MPTLKMSRAEFGLELKISSFQAELSGEASNS